MCKTQWCSCGAHQWQQEIRRQQERKNAIENRKDETPIPFLSSPKTFLYLFLFPPAAKILLYVHSFIFQRDNNADEHTACRAVTPTNSFNGFRIITIYNHFNTLLLPLDRPTEHWFFFQIAFLPPLRIQIYGKRSETPGRWNTFEILSRHTNVLAIIYAAGNAESHTHITRIDRIATRMEELETSFRCMNIHPDKSFQVVKYVPPAESC